MRAGSQVSLPTGVLHLAPLCSRGGKVVAGRVGGNNENYAGQLLS